MSKQKCRFCLQDLKTNIFGSACSKCCLEMKLCTWCKKPFNGDYSNTITYDISPSKLIFHKECSSNAAAYAKTCFRCTKPLEFLAFGVLCISCGYSEGVCRVCKRKCKPDDASGYNLPEGSKINLHKDGCKAIYIKLTNRCYICFEHLLGREIPPCYNCHIRYQICGWCKNTTTNDLFGRKEIQFSDGLTMYVHGGDCYYNYFTRMGLCFYPRCSYPRAGRFFCSDHKCVLVGCDNAKDDGGVIPHCRDHYYHLVRPSL